MVEMTARNGAGSGTVFFDANILLEVLLMRKHAAVAQDILYLYGGQGHISTLTAHLVVYFSQPYYSFEQIQDFLADFKMLPLLPRDISWAFRNTIGEDYEDALQISIALHANISEFITFDQKLVTRYQQFDEMKVQLLKVK